MTTRYMRVANQRIIEIRDTNDYSSVPWEQDIIPTDNPAVRVSDDWQVSAGGRSHWLIRRDGGPLDPYEEEQPLADWQGEVCEALKAERDRALHEDGTVMTTADVGDARFSLTFFDQQNIAALGITGDPAFSGANKTSLDKGEVALTAAECTTLAHQSRLRVVQVVDWYKAQKALVLTSSDPDSLLPFAAPIET